MLRRLVRVGVAHGPPPHTLPAPMYWALSLATTRMCMGTPSSPDGRGKRQRSETATAPRTAVHHNNNNNNNNNNSRSSSSSGLAKTALSPEPESAAGERASGDGTDPGGESIILEDDLEDFMAQLHSEKVAATGGPAPLPTSQSVHRSGTAGVTAAPSPARDSREAAVSLSPDQAEALRLALAGENLFITGGAGTGKSVLLREIVRALRERANDNHYGSKRSRRSDRGGDGDDRGGSDTPLPHRFPAKGHFHNTYVTATTGVAALNVGGMTINAFSGVNYNDPRQSKEEMFKKMRWWGRKAVGRWAYARTVIIDEISMMEPDTFEKINYIAKQAKKNPSQAFGGIQIILCGDFLQLPPVTAESPSPPAASMDPSSAGAWGDDEFDDEPGVRADMAAVFAAAARPPPARARYCFQTETWQELRLRTVVLDTMHRHGQDAVFQRVLADVRQGLLTPDAVQALAARQAHCLDAAEAKHSSRDAGGARSPRWSSSPPSYRHGGATTHYVQLCGTNREVDARNAKYFAELPPRTLPGNFFAPLPTEAVHHQGRSSSSSSGSVDDNRSGDAAVWPVHTYFAFDTQTTVEGGRKAKGKPSTVGGGGGYGPTMTHHVISPPVLQSARAADSTAESTAVGRAVRQSQLHRQALLPQWARVYEGTARHFRDTNLQAMLPLKLGTTAMLLTNISTRLKLVNGSVGEVTGFLHPLELVELTLLAPREFKKATERANIERERQHRRQPQPPPAPGEAAAVAADTTDTDPHSARARALLTMGGFHTYRDVFRCVDTSLQESLFRHLRANRFFSERHLRETCGNRERVENARGHHGRSRAEPASAATLMQWISYGSVFGQEHLTSLMRVAGVRGVGAAGAAATAPDANTLYLDSFSPADLAAMRLPVVRFHVAGLAREDRGGTGGGSTEVGRETDAAAASAETTVHAFIAPSVYATHTGATVALFADDARGAASTSMTAGTYYTRTQLPLRHAWAITVHKAQGLTLPGLEIDASRFFSPGQAYVALSRARSLEGVRLMNFNPNAVRACPVAKQFYERLTPEKPQGPSTEGDHSVIL